MTTIHNRIYPLDDISQSKIKYSVQILSLTDVVLELIKNALDAQAENIKITLNYAHGFCSILDDGHGISANEFEPDGGLGKPFHTSKLGQAHECYGHNGRYLAALSAMSLLSVASRVDGADTHVLWLDQSGRLRHAREPPDAMEFETGTKVKVYGLFSKLPVRSKALIDRFASPSEVQKEFERLKNEILGLILAASRDFGIVVEHSSPKHNYRYKLPQEHTKPLSLSHNKNLSCINLAIRQAGHADASQLSQWQETAIQSDGIALRGLISTLPLPHKMVQYLSLNHLPLTRQAQPDLFHLINSMFEQSAFGSTGNADITDSVVSPHKKRLRNHAKEVDKWPMFVIWISTTLDSVDELAHDSIASPRAQRLLTRIASLIQSLIEEFLVTHDYKRPRREVQPQRERVPRHSEGTRDADTSQAALVDRRRDQSMESFRHWSQVRSSRESAMDNILTGLPFHGKPGIHQKEALSVNKHLHPSEEAPNASEVVVDIETPAFSLSAEGVDEQDCVLRTDPQISRILRPDPRTGMELPSRPALSDSKNKSSAHQDSPIPSCPRSSNVDRSSQEEEPGLSLAEVARNVRYYHQRLGLRQDQPIRMIGFLTDIDKDIEQCRSAATSLKAESFWAGLDRCGIHQSVQIETPSISIKALRSARVLRQVNREFILVSVQEPNPSHNARNDQPGQLVLVDQHAADERCKVEALLKSVYEDQGIQLTNQVNFDISKKESDVLRSASAYFAQWNIHYELSETRRENSEHPVRQVKVTSLPSAIAERCRLYPEFIINILREEIYSDKRSFQYTKKIQPTKPTPIYNIPIPPRLLEMINSRACHSAIRFRDELTIEQCEVLVGQLGRCTLPFQCAHGRPSMVVLTDISDLPVNRPLASEITETSTYFNINRNTSKRGTALNTVENTMPFGQAYHTWINAR